MTVMRQGFLSIGVQDNSVLIYPDLADSASLFLAANSDTPFFAGFVDLTDGRWCSTSRRWPRRQPGTQSAAIELSVKAACGYRWSGKDVAGPGDHGTTQLRRHAGSNPASASLPAPTRWPSHCA